MLLRRCFVPSVIALVTIGTFATAQVDSFRPVSNFVVPDGGVAEIVSASPDGNTVVYSNSIGSTIGFVDISDPSAPEFLFDMPVEGSPTSVAVTPDGDMVLAVVNTSVLEEGERPKFAPGKLLAFSLPGAEALGAVDLGEGPDSIAVTAINGELVAVVAIENEPVIVDKKHQIVDDDAPGSPDDVSKRGLVQVITVNRDEFSKSHVKNVFMPNRVAFETAGLDYPDDPQPEYIAIRGKYAAVTLQENNGIAIIDLDDLNRPRVIDLFSAGRVTDRPADLVEDAIIDFANIYPAETLAAEEHAGARVPDAIAWNAAGTALFTADEGEIDFTGGRGISARTRHGDFLWDDGGMVEETAVRRGQYDDGRSEAKGVEMEGLATGVFGAKEFVFGSSERGSFIVVYEISDAANPTFVQLLPTGIGPESVLPLPQRGLVLTSDEGDDGFGSITIFEGIAGDYTPSADVPMVRADSIADYFAALSALAADPDDSGLLYSVPDDALVSTIYAIEVGGPIARISHLTPVTIEGEQAIYDLEGIVVDTSTAAPAEPGFWICSEGNAEFGEEGVTRNLLVQVGIDGAVLQEIGLPTDIEPEEAPEDDLGTVRSNGFEGLTLSDDGSKILAAIQRGFNGEEAVGGVLHTRIGVYDLAAATWSFFLYPLDAHSGGATVGLSEITNLGGDVYAVIERDNQFGSGAEIKKIYQFTLDGVDPYEGVVLADSDLTGKVITKTELADVLADFSPFEKVEGLALTPSGDLWSVLDNDGGVFEPRLVRIGNISP